MKKCLNNNDIGLIFDMNTATLYYINRNACRLTNLTYTTNSKHLCL